MSGSHSWFDISASRATHDNSFYLITLAKIAIGRIDRNSQESLCLVIEDLFVG